MQMNEQIDIIIAKKLAGEASDEDVRLLDEWLAADAGNKTVYEQVAKAWQRSEELLNGSSFNKTAAWDKVASRIAVAPAEVKKGRVMPLWVKYASGIAAILLVGLIIMRPGADSGMVTMIAEAGNVDVVLPDNSHITLRKGSKLTYPKTFAGNTRNVSLDGEAFFEVHRDVTKPFIIDAQSVDVRVLGTSFDVTCNENDATVTVATGKVQMTAKQKAGNYVILTPGEHGIYKQQQLTETTIEGTNYLFWKTGKLIYENKSLEYITNELSQLYAAQITLDATMTPDIRQQLINISFNNQSIEEILNELCLVAQCKWQQTDNNYVILAK